MTNLLKIGIVTVSLLLMSACATTSDHMTPVAQPEIIPEPGKAVVVFLRPSSYGGAVQSTVYHDMDYIGTVSAHTKVAYQTTPGEHMFMVIGESADFMRATLAEGKIYYAVVAARMGVWKARFSFKPQNGQTSPQELQEWLANTRLVEANPKGEAWAKANAVSIKEKHDEYLQKWMAKADNDKQTLLESSGH